MDKELMIEKFREKIKEKVFNEYTNHGIIKTRVCLLAKERDGNWFISFKNVPGFLHLEGDEFEETYDRILKSIHKLIRVVKEDDNEVIAIIHVEGGEEDGKDYIFFSLKTGDNFDDVEIQSFVVEHPPIEVSVTGELIFGKPNFVEMSLLD